jgi:hypothetical protein
MSMVQIVLPADSQQSSKQTQTISNNLRSSEKMSSLAATQADGYYIPPEFFESGQYKKKTLNQFNNDYKGHNQFVTNAVVRFEMPHDGFCKQCVVYF